MEIYRVDYFLLAPEWKEDGVDGSRISFCIKGGDTKEEHEAFCQKEISRLLAEHDEDYTSWVETSRNTKEFYGALKFATVVNFRIRDAW